MLRKFPALEQMSSVSNLLILDFGGRALYVDSVPVCSVLTCKLI
jgi:hypothetical protein